MISYWSVNFFSLSPNLKKKEEEEEEVLVRYFLDLNVPSTACGHLRTYLMLSIFVCSVRGYVTDGIICIDYPASQIQSTFQN